MTFSKFPSRQQNGFTLVELLMVISIIGLLSSIVLASLATARAKARDMVRLSDLKQLQIALEMYRTDNGAYPATFAVGDSTVWKAGMNNCVNGVSGSGYLDSDLSNGGYIHGVAPKYISKLPEDPATLALPASNPRCYAYASNGTDYVVTALNSEGYTAPSNLRRLNGSSINMAIFTSGAVTW